MNYIPRQRSSAWFLLPIFLGLIGGIIAYFILRTDDPPKAKNCFYLGLAMMVVGIIFNLIIIGSIPEFESGLSVNV